MRFISVVLGTAIAVTGAKLLISWPVQTSIVLLCASGAIVALVILSLICQWVDNTIDDIQWRHYLWKRERNLNRGEIIYNTITRKFEIEKDENH